MPFPSGSEIILVGFSVVITASSSTILIILEETTVTFSENTLAVLDKIISFPSFLLKLKLIYFLGIN